MSKALTRNSTWQRRSGSFATHGARTGVNLLGWDCVVDESMDGTQKRDALSAHRRYLEGELAKAKDVGDREAIAILGQKINETCLKASAIRRCRKDRGLSNYILDILKPRYSRAEWDRIVREARSIMDAEARITTEDGK
ncbi:hypothetical protein [Burkholderia gladioli]|uniref:hypothetical protein n=1 Tax=Burkholderia gladioli TaxID=28095 RepID=UPI0011B28F98|nr:hypothetical protein [Burkholderia gladioli]